MLKIRDGKSLANPCRVAAATYDALDRWFIVRAAMVWFHLTSSSRNRHAYTVEKRPGERGRCRRRKRLLQPWLTGLETRPGDGWNGGEMATMNMAKWGRGGWYSARMVLSMALGFGQYEQSIKVGSGSGARYCDMVGRSHGVRQQVCRDSQKENVGGRQLRRVVVLRPT